MTYLPFEEWLNSLEPEDRAKAEKLLARFGELGADEPEERMRSEIEEGIPQLARFLFIRSVLTKQVNQWKEEPQLWINACKGDPEHNLYAPFPDVGSALTRMLAAGISMADIASVARMIAYATSWDLLQQIDSGRDNEASDDDPGWRLMETDPNGEQTNRELGGLHEDMLTDMERILSAEEG